MTIADNLIPYYVRFLWGFGYLSVIMSLVSFGMSLVTMITVKGFYMPLWLIPVVAILVVGLCTAIGVYAEKFDVQNRIGSHINKKANPELTDMAKDIVEIKKLLLHDKDFIP